MPETQRPSEIQSKEDAAQNYAGKCDVVAQSRQRPVFRAVKQIDQCGEKVASAGKAAEKKVKHDQPTQSGGALKNVLDGNVFMAAPHGRPAWSRDCGN